MPRTFRLRPLSCMQPRAVPPSAREIPTRLCEQFGAPHYVNLSDAINTWSAATSKEPPTWTAEKWSRPDDEAAKLSLPGQFVDAVLSAPFNPPVCSRALCTSLIRELDAKNASDTYPWSCCMLKFSALGDNLGATKANVGATVEELGDVWTGRVTQCLDLLGSGKPFVNALSEGSAMLTIVAAMSEKDANCTQGCPYLRPLCKGGKCVRPTCSDLSAGLCMRPSEAGAMARLMCSKTCGCSDPLSPLLVTGTKSGCLAPCDNARFGIQAAGKKGADGKYQCIDAQPNSTELRALIRFATSNAVVTEFNLDDAANTTLWATLGCFALNVYDKASLCDLDGTLLRRGMKSFMSFCPVTCGCASDRLLPEVKAICPSPCKTIKSPVWNYMDDVPIGDYIESSAEYIKSSAYDDSVVAFISRLSGSTPPPPPAGADVPLVAKHLRGLYGESIWHYTLATRFGLGVLPAPSAPGPRPPPRPPIPSLLSSPSLSIGSSPFSHLLCCVS